MKLPEHLKDFPTHLLPVNLDTDAGPRFVVIEPARFFELAAYSWRARLTESGSGLHVYRRARDPQTGVRQKIVLEDATRAVHSASRGANTRAYVLRSAVIQWMRTHCFRRGQSAFTRLQAAQILQAVAGGQPALQGASFQDLAQEVNDLFGFTPELHHLRDLVTGRRWRVPGFDYSKTRDFGKVAPEPAPAVSAPIDATVLPNLINTVESLEQIVVVTLEAVRSRLGELRALEKYQQDKTQQ